MNALRKKYADPGQELLWRPFYDLHPSLRQRGREIIVGGIRGRVELETIRDRLVALKETFSPEESPRPDHLEPRE